MPDTTPLEPLGNTSAGHLTVHLTAGPQEVVFSFERPQKHVGPAFVASLASHIAVFLVGVLLVRYASRVDQTAPFLPQINPNAIIWLSQPGPGGGGGGGGNKMKEPPRKAELPGKDTITVPVTKPPALEVPKEVPKEPELVAQLNIPAQELASAKDSLPGALEGPPVPSLSQGSGSGGGAGTGRGTGIGPGTGSGLGPGSGGGTGGGTYRLGSGVTTPVLLREVKPAYTSDAMRAKIQGTVLVQCVVKTDGSVGDVEVIRSLDSTFGLDQEAIKAARQWRFRPGTLKGEAVPVLITIELTFTLR